MSDNPKKIDLPWGELVAAIRETGTRIVEQMRESFGPHIRLMTSEAQAALDAVEESQGPEAAGRLLAAALIEQEENPPTKLKREIRDAVLTYCGFEDAAEVTADGSADNDLAQERADAVMTFLDLVRRHPLPNKLLPRGDRVGDWLAPGTEVTVLGRHPAVVVPSRDMVTVKLEGSDVVTEFPRMSIVRKGEQWTPQKRTIS